MRSRRRSIPKPGPPRAADTGIIFITTMTMMTEPGALLRLLAWLSPSFPTGAYAYSHGLEWAVEWGDILDETALADWLTDVLTHGSGRNDAILLRHAHRGGDFCRLNDLAIAVAGSRERQMETLDQGTAF